MCFCLFFCSLIEAENENTGVTSLLAQNVVVPPEGFKPRSTRAYIPELKSHFKCSRCESTFITSYQLHLHEMTHDAETKGSPKSQSRSHKCVDCDRPFFMKGHLTKHFQSQMHVECLERKQKVPAGTFQKISKARINFSGIDTAEKCVESLNAFAKLINDLPQGTELLESQVAGHTFQIGKDEIGKC